MYGYSTNELYHHGVKGMRWGVRNYQNPDGTLTPEGRRRYDVGGNLVRNSKEGVLRSKRIGKNAYLETERRLKDVNENGKIKQRIEYSDKARIKNRRSVADWYNLQRNATLYSIKKDARDSVKYGSRTKSEAKADYKAAKRDVDRIMTKYYGKTISEAAKQQRGLDTAATVMGVTFLAALPAATIASYYINK